MKAQRLLVTGGAGFLGCYFVRHALDRGAAAVGNIDLLSYAGDLKRLTDIEANPAYSFFRADVADQTAVSEIVGSFEPDAIVHYAAESHVTRSESDPEGFHRTNVEGTRALLEAAVEFGVRRFVHVSTDEVYGPIVSGSFREEDKPLGEGNATSPYARSKAIADDLALEHSGKLEVVVARPTNAFGPWQFPEKALPRWITRALSGRNLLVWGDGLYVRQWLYAEDFARAIGILLEKGMASQAYNVGPVHEPEITNIALARWIVEHLGLDESRIEMTQYDRPDHDRRYCVDPTKIRALGWEPGDVWSQLASTLSWYRSNRAWWMSHVAEAESIYSDSKR